MNPTKTINVKFAECVAAEYERMPHAPFNKEVKLAYLHLASETLRQYKTVLSYGLRVEFDDGQSLYRAPQDAIEDIANHNHLYVFPTEGNFGTDKSFKSTRNPLLDYSGLTISSQPALINDLFRVIHDYFGHYRGQNGFRALGEENAYRYHCGMFSTLAQKALTTETRGQNCWLNYGPHGEHNQKANQADTIYADQKTGLLPTFCMEEY